MDEHVFPDGSTMSQWTAQKAAADWWLPRVLECIGDRLIIWSYYLRGML